MRNLFKSVHFVIALALLLFNCLSLCELTSLAKNDPYPVYTTEIYKNLYRRPCLDPEDIYCIHAQKQRFSITISPFGQSACRGTNVHGEKYLPAQVCNPIDCGSSIIGPIHGNIVQLGDLTGRINMIALLYGEPPVDQDLPLSLKNAARCLFNEFLDDPDLLAEEIIVPSCIPGNPDPNNPENMPCTHVNDPSLIDPTERYASLTFPIKYNKRGVRFDIAANIGRGFGFNLEAGIAHISQSVQRIRLNRIPTGDAGFTNIENDLTCQAETLCDFQLPNDPNNPFTILGPCANFTDNVKKLLTGNLNQIADQLGVDICDFNTTSAEEIRLNVYWRHNIEVNKDNTDGPKAICMPFLMLSGSVSPGKKKHPDKLFAVPFGNDGHSSVGFTGGLTIDFINSIELAGEIGTTHFFSKTVDSLRVPNSIYQKTLFPFVADARVSPGNNWHFAGTIASHHFLGNLSTYFQYVMINHSHDSICLKTPDPAFTPATLEKTTAWKSKLANVGFTYDISPTVALGFLWQAPLAQKNAYKTSTILFSFNATF